MQRLIPALLAVVLMACATSTTTDTTASSMKSSAMLEESITTEATLTSAAVDKTGWWLRICMEHTESRLVEIAVGTDANNHEEVVWPPQGVQPPPNEIDVPAKYKQQTPLWVRVRVFDGRRANLCLVQQTTSRQVFDTFREQIATVKATDTQACPCSITP